MIQVMLLQFPSGVIWKTANINFKTFFNPLNKKIKTYFRSPCKGRTHDYGVISTTLTHHAPPSSSGANETKVVVAVSCTNVFGLLFVPLACCAGALPFELILRLPIESCDASFCSWIGLKYSSSIFCSNRVYSRRSQSTEIDIGNQSIHSISIDINRRLGRVP